MGLFNREALLFPVKINILLNIMKEVSRCAVETVNFNGKYAVKATTKASFHESLDYLYDI